MSSRLSHWLCRNSLSGMSSSRPPSCRPCVEELESRLAPSATVGPNVPVTTDAGVQQMPSVAVDPHDASRLVVAYLDYSLVTTGYAGIGVAVSNDGGTTWQHTSVSLPAGFDQGAAAPVAHFDDQGHVFVSFAAATFLGGLPSLTDPGGGAPRALGFQADNGVFVVRSDDGGLTWGAPVAVVAHLYDGHDSVPFEIKPDLAIDTFPTLPNGQTNPNYGSLYEVWSRYYPAGQFPGEPAAIGGSDIMFAVSRDGDQSWRIQTQLQPGTGIPVTVIQNYQNTGLDTVQGTGHENWAHVTIGPEGDIYVSNFLGGQFGVHHSADGGASFDNPLPNTNALYPFGYNNDIVANPTLDTSNFRTQNVRAIAADPLRPGTVYAVEAEQIDDPFGNILDEGDVIFARSTDYGATWQTTFQVGTQTANVLNDDNGGQRATGLPDDVTDGQALPHLVTDAQGDVEVIWYDTRRDPADHLLDVFGTISSDGGQTFSPNFRITDQSFDANVGSFTAADGSTSYYLGDALGLAMTNGIADAVWTDTRNGNQDVFFAGYPVSPPPAAANDRFEPNDTAGTATDLGLVITRNLPKLAIAPGDEDWFRLQAAATGHLTVTATLAAPGDSLRLELRDASGATLLATGTPLLNGAGQVIGQSFDFPGHSGQTYLLRVLPGPDASAGAPADYTLDVRSLTADLGAQVFGVENSSLGAGDQALYALSVPAAGSLDVTLTPGSNAQGNLRVELLDPNNLSVLASGQATGSSQEATLTVTHGQAVYLRVDGDAAAQGDFTLTFSNLDQFTTANITTLFVPTGTGPSEAALADVNRDGKPDIIVSHVGEDTVSVLLNNGDGTFQAPRDFAVGPFVVGSSSTLSGLPNFHRELAVADVNGDGNPDIIAVNHDAGDLSILLGRGDGTFAPQQLVDATSAPFALAVGDLNNDGIPDLAVVDSTSGPARGIVLLGRGDGTFRAPIPFALPHGEVFRTNAISIADVNHDGKNDLVERDFVSGTVVLLGNGDGTFGAAISAQASNGPGLAIADLNGDGIPDLVTTIDTQNLLEYSLGNGDGTFQAVQQLSPGQTPVAVVVADFGSAVTLPDGSTVLGPPDGHPDLIVADNGLTQAVFNGPPEIVLLPGLVDAQGNFAGFGAPIHLASAHGPLDVKAEDVNGDGVTDIVVVDSDGVEVIYGKPPVIPSNNSPQTPRNLGTVVHVVEPAQTIVPGHEDAYYTLTVPTEAARGAGNEILDFSGLFQATSGTGLSMEVRGAAGRLLGAGERFRVSAPQGAVLTLHVFGVMGAGGTTGFGAFTLDIDVLPQVVSVEAQPLLPGQAQNPGGPTASLVLTFQGDRLDPVVAENPANYRVTWLGPDGVLGTADDQVIAVSTETTGGQSVVYDPGADIDVTSGKTYPTAVRQTVTLLFADPLPNGSYVIELAPVLQAAPFNQNEAGLLSSAAGITGHSLVSVVSGAVTEGDRRTVTGLVAAGGTVGDPAALKAGTPFLSQLHDDLGALLDARLTTLGDSRTISAAINLQIVDRFDPALGARPFAVLVIWLDPVVVDLDGGSRGRASFDPRSVNSYQNTFAQAFVSVTGSVELLVLAFVPTGVQNYVLNVEPTPTARGGLAYFGPEGNEVRSLTASLREGTSQFLLSFGDPTVVSGPTTRGSAVTPRDPAPDALRATEVLFALNSDRSDMAGVRPTTPYPGPTQADVPTAAAAAAAVVARGAALSQIAGSGGTAADPAETREIFMERVLRLIAELGRKFPSLARSFGNILRSLGVRFAVQAPGPALQPPAADKPVPIEGAEAEEKLSPLADGETAQVQPEASPSQAQALLAAVVGLTAGYFVRRKRHNHKDERRGVSPPVSAKPAG